MKNQRIRTEKSCMKGILLAGIILFECVFAGMISASAQKIFEQDSVMAENEVSLNSVVKQVSSEVKSEEVQAEGDSEETPEIIYSGKNKNVVWSIDENGQLLITGEGNYEGYPTFGSGRFARHRYHRRTVFLV